MIYKDYKIKQICKEIELLNAQKVGFERFNNINLLTAKTLLLKKLNETLELMQEFNKTGDKMLKAKIEQNEIDIYEIYKEFDALLKDSKELKELAQKHIAAGLKAFGKRIWLFVLKYFFKIMAVFWFLGFASISFYLGYAPKIGLSDTEFTGAMIIFAFMLTILIGIYPLSVYFSFRLFSGYSKLSFSFNIVSFCFISMLILSDVLNCELINLINEYPKMAFGIYAALLAIFSAIVAIVLILNKKDKEAFINAFLAFVCTLYSDMFLVLILKINNPNQSEFFIPLAIALALFAVGARLFISNSYIFNFKAAIIAMTVLIISVSVFRGDRLIATFGLDKHLTQTQSKISN
ncbi:hypothetical protein [Campylobacter sp. 19-13652]|uniref:hypothetical protein n=1 Tax=Campylobacter sp. 19-13652 TaxID=2840180 RepID=UPI001C77FF66|nr:hypothetical protein [Campylobacter sp. 19-13652]BCX79858.1 hypothetical protein LBC_13200 [Campylobacter sp. 19-13652]